jgi:hypothetical protein
MRSAALGRARNEFLKVVSQVLLIRQPECAATEMFSRRGNAGRINGFFTTPAQN